MSKKFKSNGIVIRMGAAHDEIQFNVKDEGLHIVRLDTMKRRARMGVIAEMITDWKKGRFDLPLVRA